MKLELTYDEVSTICHALLLKAEEAATGARECAKLGDMDNIHRQRAARLIAWREKR